MKPTSSHLSLTGYYGLYVVPPDSYVSPSVQFSHSVVSDSFWLLSTLTGVGNAIQPSHPLLSPSSPSALTLFQHQGLFQWVSSLHQVGRSIGASDSASVLPMNIPFRIDWFDFLAIQGTLKSLLQHHSLKASMLHRSAFFIVQLSHLYMTTGKP